MAAYNIDIEDNKYHPGKTSVRVTDERGRQVAFHGTGTAEDGIKSAESDMRSRGLTPSGKVNWFGRRG